MHWRFISHFQLSFRPASQLIFNILRNIEDRSIRNMCVACIYSHTYVHTFTNIHAILSPNCSGLQTWSHLIISLSPTLQIWSIRNPELSSHWSHSYLQSINLPLAFPNWFSCISIGSSIAFFHTTARMISIYIKVDNAIIC